MRSEFTLSYHFFQQKDSRNHLELFLDHDGESALETWRSFQGGQLKENRRHRFVKAPDHRRIYLSFSGQVSGERGRLRILRQGNFIDRRQRKSEFIKVTL